MGETIQVSTSHLLGGAVCRDGVNYSVYSEGSTALDLLLIDVADDPQPARMIAVAPVRYHSLCQATKAGQIYGYRVNGVSDTVQVHTDSFTPKKSLI